MAVNKVVQSNGATLIDISDTTALAADVASGKYFYLASGEKVEGTASGVHTEEGYVELTDTQTEQIVIPVDLRNAEGFLLNAYVVETGEVSDGAVTKYDKIEIPTEFSGTNKQFIYSYAVKYPQNPIPEIYRDSSNLVSVRQVVNVNYNFAYRGNNGGSAGINLNPTINANGVTLPAMNGTRYFCMAGAYVKFKYEIKWW